MAILLFLSVLCKNVLIMNQDRDVKTAANRNPKERKIFKLI